MVDTVATEEWVDKADEFYKRIRDYRHSKRSEPERDGYGRLRDLYHEVRALKLVTRIVSQTSNTSYIKIETFDQINAHLGLEPRLQQTFDSGLELLCIDVSDYDGC